MASEMEDQNPFEILAISKGFEVGGLDSDSRIERMRVRVEGVRAFNCLAI